MDTIYSSDVLYYICSEAVAVGGRALTAPG